jgi:uncharacterized protein (DUF1800 family)
MPMRCLTLLLCLLATTAATAAPPKRADVLWLQRLSFGVDTASLERLRKLGRQRYLNEQLAGRDDDLPPAVAAQIAALDVARRAPLALLAEADGPAFKPRAREVLQQAVQAQLLRALHSPAQLREVMTWFWANHFSVFEGKAAVRWFAHDYVERAIRPRALGRYRDLVLAAVTHPAMLMYLDNRRNADGRLNENLAREVLELHTLGVGGGYTQADVQALARILTGAGVRLEGEKRRPQPGYRRDGAFEFDPARHDDGEKVLLGRTFRGGGFVEIEQAVEHIVKQPACARFVSRRLATYFVADHPPPALVDRMVRTFRRTDGDLAAVLRTLFTSPELEASLGKKLEDPVQFVVSALRLAYDGRPIANVRPVARWLDRLGEAPFGRRTPDGYPLVAAGWTASGQLAERFEVARAIGAGDPDLFDREHGPGGFPRLASRLFYEVVEPHLSPATREALDRAASQEEWNTFLLASPELNHR